MAEAPRKKRRRALPVLKVAPRKALAIVPAAPPPPQKKRPRSQSFSQSQAFGKPGLSRSQSMSRLGLTSSSRGALQQSQSGPSKAAQFEDLYIVSSATNVEPMMPSSQFLQEYRGPNQPGCKLYDYQAHALSWLVKREGPITIPSDVVVEPPPGWEEQYTEYGELYWVDPVNQISAWPPQAHPQQAQAHIQPAPLQRSERPGVLGDSMSPIRGGILADEMGLGKTIEMISLIATNRRPSLGPAGRQKPLIDQYPRATLVVAPASILRQWKREIQKCSDPLNPLTVSKYHASEQIRDPLRLANYDVVLTTYETLATDTFKGGNILGQIKWLRVILDEGQKIKNPKSQFLSQAVYDLDSEIRWVTSGTPIQNNLEDLYSLVKFFRLQPYADDTFWKRAISLPLQNIANKSVATDRVRDLLGTILLRRRQGQMFKGKIIGELPPKEIIVRMLQFSPYEATLYNRLRAAAGQRIEEAPGEIILPPSEELPRDNDEPAQIALRYESNTVLQILNQMRQLCDHPWLILYSEEQMKARMNPRDFETSTKLTEINRILTETRERDPTIKTLIFSQWTRMLDIIQYDLHLLGMYTTRLQGTMSEATRDQNITLFTENPNVNVFLISLGAGGYGLNLVAASQVILVDPWWNPTTEDQAIARAYRGGQKRPVTVYRLLIDNTIEEKMLQLQQYKEELASASGLPKEVQALEEVRFLLL